MFGDRCECRPLCFLGRQPVQNSIYRDGHPVLTCLVIKASVIWMSHSTVAKIENLQETPLIFRWEFGNQVIPRLATIEQFPCSILSLADHLSLKIAFHTDDVTKCAQCDSATVQNSTVYCTFIAIYTRCILPAFSPCPKNMQAVFPICCSEVCARHISHRFKVSHGTSCAVSSS